LRRSGLIYTNPWGNHGKEQVQQENKDGCAAFLDTFIEPLSSMAIHLGYLKPVTLVACVFQLHSGGLSLWQTSRELVRGTNGGAAPVDAHSQVYAPRAAVRSHRYNIQVGAFP
jgi:hypothetical protein